MEKYGTTELDMLVKWFMVIASSETRLQFIYQKSFLCFPMSQIFQTYPQVAQNNRLHQALLILSLMKKVMQFCSSRSAYLTYQVFDERLSTLLLERG